MGGPGWAPDALATFARGAQLLLHGAVYPMTPTLAAELGLPEDGIARRAGVETLVLVRLRPPPVYDFQLSGLIGRNFDGRLVIPDDGDRVWP